MPIDYSKWDNLDEYSDSDDDDDEQQQDNAPRVTRLDGPSQVTFGGATNRNSNDAPSVTIRPSQASTNSSNSATTTAALNPNKQSAQPPGKSSKNPDTKNATSQEYNMWQEKGGMVSIDASDNSQRRLFWSQSQEGKRYSAYDLGEWDRIQDVSTV